MSPSYGGVRVLGKMTAEIEPEKSVMQLSFSEAFHDFFSLLDVPKSECVAASARISFASDLDQV
jgi:hypothetical protein